jgi:sigma-B regulation protein RsbU (phosphoserine phosphatase)
LNASIEAMCSSLHIEAEKLYDGILEGIDDIIGVYKPDNSLLFYNKAGYKFFNTSPEEIIGKKCYHMLCREHRCTQCTTLLALEKGGMVRLEKFIPELNKYMECTANPVYSDEGELILIVEQLRDITEEKSDLKKAANIQKQRLEIAFPIVEYGQLKSIYQPAMDISGDFYHLCKIGSNCVIGLLGDVSGKGISAALSISAVKVLFYEAANHLTEPAEILSYINNKLINHFSDDYVAACCFKLDFENWSMDVACAAINEFRTIKQDTENKHEIPGLFLGMFKDTIFEQRKYAIDSGDKLIFYTDGLQLLEDKGQITIDELYKMDEEAANLKVKNLLKNIEGTKDDCTLLTIKIL